MDTMPVLEEPADTVPAQVDPERAFELCLLEAEYLHAQVATWGPSVILNPDPGCDTFALDLSEFGR